MASHIGRDDSHQMQQFSQFLATDSCLFQTQSLVEIHNVTKNGTAVNEGKRKE